MPTYEYRCQGCGHEFERFQSITADPLKDCPECQGEVKRLISTGAGFIFKGSGFYITDYRSDSYQKAAKADSAAPAKSDGACGGGSCGKPECAPKPASTSSPSTSP